MALRDQLDMLLFPAMVCYHGTKFGELSDGELEKYIRSPNTTNRHAIWKRKASSP